MHPIAASYSTFWPMPWRPTRAVFLVMAMLLGYAALLAPLAWTTCADQDVSRVELLE